MNEESIRKRIQALLDEIQSEADPVLLNRCRSIFRQEVSFFRRSYMAAYLLLLAEGSINNAKTAKLSHSGGEPSFTAVRPEGDYGSRNRRPGPAGPSSQFSERSDRTETAQVLISEEESVRLFVSIGRNRKVFPRDILALINARAKVAREDIGMIRILDNYSFVQVRNSAADAVIQALNGQRFRGRTLTVNYARSRQEGEEDLPEDVNSVRLNSTDAPDKSTLIMES